ncbi:hypothetical protein EXIGLDRAFT_735278 [Exidia glandulosa HHB12029]|uniref:GPI anchored protein n=1 Tax=Exidia glandulosa HHB12029 TaxID=1314781 RepID=A0A166NLS9_EXIGL|nr:hypothetical protein EXIGLDRAFT_735278 [Exidia glandulosa HHB12029]
MHISIWIPLALALTLASAASTSVRKGGQSVESSFGFPGSSGSTTFLESVSGSDYSTVFTSSPDSVTSTFPGGESTSSGFISDSSTTTGGGGSTTTVSEPGTGTHTVSTPKGTGTGTGAGSGTITVTTTTTTTTTTTGTGAPEGGPSSGPDTNNTGAAPGRARVTAGIAALFGVALFSVNL